MRRDNNGQKSDYFDLVCSLFVALVDGTIGLSVVIANVSRSHVLVTFSVGRLHFMRLFPCRARTMASFDGRCRLWPSSHVSCECVWCAPCTSRSDEIFFPLLFSLFFVWLIHVRASDETFGVTMRLCECSAAAMTERGQREINSKK